MKKGFAHVFLFIFVVLVGIVVVGYVASRNTQPKLNQDVEVGQSVSNNNGILVDCPKTSGEMTYFQSYMQGNKCRFSTKSECETADVIAINNGHPSQGWDQDGISDCVWGDSEETSYCFPKYTCKK